MQRLSAPGSCPVAHGYEYDNNDQTLSGKAYVDSVVLSLTATALDLVGLGPPRAASNTITSGDPRRPVVTEPHVAVGFERFIQYQANRQIGTFANESEIVQ